MTITFANESQAKSAWQLVKMLQERFVTHLNRLSDAYGDNTHAQKIEWCRENGKNGGGNRYMLTDTTLYNRGSINISQVHYENDPRKKLDSATALSTIIHPQHPLIPSIHMHYSFTKTKNKHGTWRIMADLNPSIQDTYDKNRFEESLKSVAGELYEKGKREGEKYFTIPALQTTRGVSHFYIEGYHSGDFDADIGFVSQFAAKMIDSYAMIVEEKLKRGLSEPTREQKTKQLHYHTLYFFQVLTLDRGTTSGLLVHNQNDIGILASLPSHIDAGLIASWREKAPKLQQYLIDSFLQIIGDFGVVLIDDDIKVRLADAIRKFYRNHPDALTLQAKGSILPATLENHR